MVLPTQDRLKRVVDKIMGLPTLPTILQNINKLMMNPKTSAKEVAQLVSNDPAITAKILRVVNSSFYGFPNRINTVTHAIVILGFNTIKSIVLSTSIFDVFKKSPTATLFDREAFWRHSIACGAAAKVLAKRAGFTVLEEFFIAGLLHDVGKIVIDQHVHEDFVKIMETCMSKSLLMIEAEQEVLGTTHAEVGSWLCQKWNLAKGLVECLGCHHNPPLASDSPKHVAIIHIADILVRALQLGSGGDRRIPQVSDHAWNLIDIQAGDMPRLMAEVAEETERALIFMDFAK
ncbi:MAG: HDOD domain-containing protein [Planctomycetota bacterium]|nr:HDOD domain-containing protein [Planctomycetota bacterium]